MILTITLDPILESIYHVDNLQFGEKTKAEKMMYNISGDGLNTSRILKNHNLDVFAMGFLGGLKGQYVFNKLKDFKIYNDFTFIRDETKGDLIILKDDELLSMISQDSPRITREELGSFYQLYNAVSEKSELICGLGQLPIGVPKEIYYDLIQIGKRNNKKFILDAKGLELIYGIEGQPFMVKVNKEDLEEISKVQLNFENEIIKVGHSLIESGIELVVIDLDEKGSIVLTKNKGYRLELSQMNLSNINDDKGYIVSGYAFGIERKYDLDTIMKLGQAMRIAYAIGEDIDVIYMSDIKKIMSMIEIRTIYY